MKRYEEKIVFLNQLLNELEFYVVQLSSITPKPKIEINDIGLIFNHDEKDKNEFLAALLKLTKIVSFLNAGMVLLKNGYIQEMYIIGRCMDEFQEEITFILSGESNRKKDWLDEFYQEIVKSENGILTAKSRNRVPRKKIQAHIARISGGYKSFQDLSQFMLLTFSSFVHGAYSTIMETYGGTPDRYHMKGMINTPRMREGIEQFAHFLYRGIIAASVVARVFSRQDIFDGLKAMLDNLDQQINVVWDGKSELRHNSVVIE